MRRIVTVGFPRPQNCTGTVGVTVAV